MDEAPYLGPVTRHIPVEDLRVVLAGVMWMQGYLAATGVEVPETAKLAMRKLEEYASLQFVR